MMGFHDLYRMSSHAVITDADGRVLLLKATYGACGWGLPGGAVDPGETVHDALLRECREELGIQVSVRYLSGIYLHRNVTSHALVFRCDMPTDSTIRLSDEHSEYRYWRVGEMAPVQRQRVEDCLGFEGTVISAAF